MQFAHLHIFADTDPTPARLHPTVALLPNCSLIVIAYKGGRTYGVPLQKVRLRHKLSSLSTVQVEKILETLEIILDALQEILDALQENLDALQEILEAPEFSRENLCLIWLSSRLLYKFLSFGKKTSLFCSHLIEIFVPLQENFKPIEIIVQL